MSVVLLNAGGTPEPSPEIQRRLQGVHRGLHLRFINGVAGHWAVCLSWSDNDPRRQRIQEGDLPPDKAFDILGYLPMECSADQAPSYLERTLRTFPRQEVQRMADYLDRFNAEAPSRAVEDALAEVLDTPDPTMLVKRPRGRPKKLVS